LRVGVCSYTTVLYELKDEILLKLFALCNGLGVRNPPFINGPKGYLNGLFVGVNDSIPNLYVFDLTTLLSLILLFSI